MGVPPLDLPLFCKKPATSIICTPNRILRTQNIQCCEAMETSGWIAIIPYTSLVKFSFHIFPFHVNQCRNSIQSMVYLVLQAH